MPPAAGGGLAREPVGDGRLARRLAVASARLQLVAQIGLGEALVLVELDQGVLQDDAVRLVLALVAVLRLDLALAALQPVGGDVALAVDLDVLDLLGLLRAEEALLDGEGEDGGEHLDALGVALLGQERGAHLLGVDGRHVGAHLGLGQGLAGRLLGRVGARGGGLGRHGWVCSVAGWLRLVSLRCDGFDFIRSGKLVQHSREFFLILLDK